MGLHCLPVFPCSVLLTRSGVKDELYCMLVFELPSKLPIHCHPQLTIWSYSELLCGSDCPNIGIPLPIPSESWFALSGCTEVRPKVLCSYS